MLVFSPANGPFPPQKNKPVNCPGNPPDYLFKNLLKCISLNLRDVTMASVLKFMYENKIIAAESQGGIFRSIYREMGQTLQ